MLVHGFLSTPPGPGDLRAGHRGGSAAACPFWRRPFVFGPGGRIGDRRERV